MGGACSNMLHSIVMERRHQKSKRLSVIYDKAETWVVQCAEEKGNCKTVAIFELMKATFHCGKKTRQRSVSVRHHERSSLDPRKDNFLKLMMQSSWGFQEMQDWNKLYCTFLMACTAPLIIFPKSISRQWT
jgi:hypothetical protein